MVRQKGCCRKAQMFVKTPTRKNSIFEKIKNLVQPSHGRLLVDLKLAIAKKCFSSQSKKGFGANKSGAKARLKVHVIYPCPCCPLTHNRRGFLPHFPAESPRDISPGTCSRNWFQKTAKPINFCLKKGTLQNNTDMPRHTLGSCAQ